MATCRNTSWISFFVSPLLIAPFTCALISCGRFSVLRVLRSSPGRPQHSPQQYVVTNSCNGRLKSSAVFSALSTYSAPSTSRRIFRPFSNISFSTCSPLFGLNGNARPALHYLDQFGHVGVRAFARGADRKDLPHRASHHHRDAH